MSQQQLFRPPDLLKDSEADIARWLAAQEPETAVESLYHALETPPRSRWQALAILPIYTQRPRWLRQQLLAQLERGGRTVSLRSWIIGVEALAGDRRRSYESLAKRLATATSPELQALTLDERAWLRERLKEWPGEALQIALLLALALLCLHIGAPLFHHHRTTTLAASQTESDCTLCTLANLSAAAPPVVAQPLASGLVSLDAPIWFVALAAPRRVEVRTAARAPPAA